MDPTDNPPAGDSAEPQHPGAPETANEVASDDSNSGVGGHSETAGSDQKHGSDQDDSAPTAAELSPFAVKTDPKPHPGVDPVTGRKVDAASDPRKRPASGPTGAPKSAPEATSETVETVKKLRSTAWLAAFALPLAIVLAPIGAFVGALALIRLARLRPAIERAGIKSAVLVFPVISSVAAVVVGVLLSVAVVVIREELTELNSCMSGANTRVAEENCQTRFTEQVEQRLGQDLG